MKWRSVIFSIIGSDSKPKHHITNMVINLLPLWFLIVITLHFNWREVNWLIDIQVWTNIETMLFLFIIDQPYIILIVAVRIWMIDICILKTSNLCLMITKPYLFILMNFLFSFNIVGNITFLFFEYIGLRSSLTVQSLIIR